MSVPADDPRPTWLELARSKRVVSKLSAEVVVLKEEIAELQGELKEAHAATHDATAQQEEHDEELAQLREEVADLSRRYKQATITAEILKASVVQKETELGNLEARLARALGRTIVVDAKDEVAEMVSAIVQIKSWCEATIGPDNGRTSGIPGLGHAGSPELARLRQIHGFLTAMERKFGIREVR